MEVPKWKSLGISLTKKTNGIYTVREKAYFGNFNAGGIIIWAINYDTLDDKYSLLNAIETAVGMNKG